jgi:hypothetical protein
MKGWVKTVKTCRKNSLFTKYNPNASEEAAICLDRIEELLYHIDYKQPHGCVRVFHYTLEEANDIAFGSLENAQECFRRRFVDVPFKFFYVWAKMDISCLSSFMHSLIAATLANLVAYRQSYVVVIHYHGLQHKFKAFPALTPERFVRDLLYMNPDDGSVVPNGLLLAVHARRGRIPKEPLMSGISERTWMRNAIGNVLQQKQNEKVSG